MTVDNQSDWFAARDSCKLHNARLLHITDTEDKAFVIALIKMGQYSSNLFWTAANDVETGRRRYKKVSSAMSVRLILLARKDFGLLLFSS